MAPEPVAKAEAKFLELVGELTATTAEWGARKQNYHLDLAEAHRLAAEARVAGTKAPKRTAADVDSDLARLAGEREALLAAVDVAGDALARAVEEHRGEWLAEAEELDAKNTAALADAIDAVEAACAALHTTRLAVPWLDAYDVGAALRGDRQHMTGGIGQYRQQVAQVRELVEGSEPRLIGYRHTHYEGTSTAEPIYEGTDRLGRSFTSSR
jgi:hypothetical protein